MILPSYTFYGGNVVFVPVHLFFTAAHFDLGGRYHFSFSDRRYKIFMFFFQQIGRKIENWFPCFFNSYLAFPRLCRNLNLVLRKTGLWCCCFFFLLFLSPGGHEIYHQKYSLPFSFRCSSLKFRLLHVIFTLLAFVDITSNDFAIKLQT